MKRNEEFEDGIHPLTPIYYSLQSQYYLTVPPAVETCHYSLGSIIL